MTDYELASLFYQIVDVANASLTNYLTIIFAMLVASYLAAEKLDRTGATLVTVLFSMFSLGLINEITGEYSDLARIAGEVAIRSQDAGSSLGWHPAAGTDGSAFRAIPVAVSTMCGLAYLGSIWFFFNMRRSRRRLPEATPGLIGEPAIPNEAE